MIQIRKSGERGHADHGWLNARHTFSFADYRDPKHMQFRALRVINEDRVAAGAGFPTHPHRDMEILTWVLEGAIAHKDSTGGEGILRPGEMQHMSAGTGVRHSEFNASKTEALHLLQIWLIPAKEGIAPSYDQKPFPGRGLVLTASQDARKGSLRIHQDADVWAARLAKNEEARLPLRDARYAWVQVSKGSMSVNGKMLEQGDGAALAGESEVVLKGSEECEALVFDLA
ncbi:MAG: pirin family protein [Planctomycetes bacterium]|nr:pirin family protein [Planctomycetota bacterium]